MAVFAVQAQGDSAARLVEDAYRAARVDEWGEVDADCGKFEAEIASEFAKQKFTFAELEEEEQSLDRLRRWYRDLKKPDVPGLPDAERAAERLVACARVLEEYAEPVYAENRSAATGDDHFA